MKECVDAMKAVLARRVTYDTLPTDDPYQFQQMHFVLRDFNSKVSFELLPSLIERLEFADWTEETDLIIQSLTPYFVRLHFI